MSKKTMFSLLLGVLVFVGLAIGGHKTYAYFIPTQPSYSYITGCGDGGCNAVWGTSSGYNHHLPVMNPQPYSSYYQQPYQQSYSYSYPSYSYNQQYSYQPYYQQQQYQQSYYQQDYSYQPSYTFDCGYNSCSGSSYYSGYSGNW